MVNESNGEKARKIVSLLPRENCGKCGFDNCGKFALAIAEGKVSPFGCQENPSAGYEISKVLGIEVPEGANVPAGNPESHHQGRGHGGGHGSGHHGHSGGHGRGGGGHHQSGGHHAGRHGH